MMVSVARSRAEPIHRSVERVRGRAPGRSPLTHHTEFDGGVGVGVDLLTPGQWRTVTFLAIDTTTEPMLRALLGDHAVDDLRDDESTSRRLAVDPVVAAPWLRVAVVDALDRWLHTPLQQALVDAERGVSRGRAARTLPDGPARAALVGEALRLARRASRDLTALLRMLSARSARVPDGLLPVLQRLVDGYAELLGEVDKRRDGDLKAVLDGWRRVVKVGPTSAPSPAASPVSPATGVNMLDPRQVPARVLGLSDDPACAEISVVVVAADDVLVRVPAFGRLVDPDVRSRLAARLVDRRSGRAGGHGLVTYDGEGFTATVPLRGMDPADVRADVFDALYDRPPARSDTDMALQEARRAVTFLAEWRRLVGMAQLGSSSSALVPRLRELADRVRPGFHGGPSPSDLDALAELGDRELGSALVGPRSDGPFAITRGAAGLLVAELVALHLAATP